jgi:lipopolysaccharide biosynthesis glycosyltransferase
MSEKQPPRTDYSEESPGVSTGADKVVICAADDHYALPLAVMLESLLENADPRVPLDVVIIDCGLTASSRHGIDTLFAREGREHFRPRWQPSRRTAGPSDPAWGHVSGVTYERLLLNDYLPGELDRVLWLDSDLLILEPIAPLLELPADESILHAVRDPFIPSVSSAFGVRDWHRLGLDRATPYFNAGVLSVDLRRWREAGIAGRALNYLETYGRSVYFNEQEALNAVVGDAWTPLDDRWNTSANPMHARRQRPGGTGPAVLHFAGRAKPWNLPGMGAVQEQYFHYLDRTPWCGQRPPRTWANRMLGWYLGSDLRRATYRLENLHLRLKHLWGH